MDADVPVYELSCLWCVATFVVCRRDYRGHEYCGDECREHAAAASHRAASARYERSLGDDGKQDRRAQRLDRAAKRAEALVLPDAGSEEVAPRAECSPPDSAPLLVMSTVGFREDAHEIHGSHHPVTDEDTRARDTRRRRVAASDLGGYQGCCRMKV